MSEQIREQVSAFLDGELPDSETELLLKRLTRDGELRESFGRYALIGESIRGTSRGLLTKGFAGRVNMAIDGEPAAAPMTAQSVIVAQGPGGLPQASREGLSYTVPPTSPAAPAGMPQARLTNYVLAHSRYSSGLDLRGVLADLLIEADEPQPTVNQAAAHVAP